MRRETSLPMLGQLHWGKSEMSEQGMSQAWDKTIRVECFLRRLPWLPKKCTHLLRVPPSAEVQDF